MMYKNIVKPFIDFLAALTGLILLSPVIVFVSLVLALVNRGTPFFLQERPGKKEKIFHIIKFKTMTDRRDHQGRLLPDADRLTKVGSFIRKVSLDEILQLINVLKGDMSLVGPRPLRTYYLPLYDDDQKRRHLVRPGITGLAQVNGRNDLSWSRKFQYDVQYVDHVNFKSDLRILVLTVKKVFQKEGVSRKGFATTIAFNGYN